MNIPPGQQHMASKQTCRSSYVQNGRFEPATFLAFNIAKILYCITLCIPTKREILLFKLSECFQNGRGRCDNTRADIEQKFCRTDVFGLFIAHVMF